MFIQHYQAIIHRILLILWITHKKKSQEEKQKRAEMIPPLHCHYTQINTSRVLPVLVMIV